MNFISFLLKLEFKILQKKKNTFKIWTKKVSNKNNEIRYILDENKKETTRNRKKKKKKMSFVIVESSYSERENKSSMCMSEKRRMCCQSVDLCTLCGHHISLFAF